MARQKNSEIDAQLRALGAPTGAIDGIYNEWEGLPFVEVVPGFLVLRQDLNVKWSTKTGHRVRVFPVSVF
ncbi:hypothetical protein ACOTY4_15095 [Enterobacter cloacae complex sp. SHL005]|uniref:hypothetical protein n=1 Tax=Enterobacter cloacae complex sp. SHL005 TaxID=3412388 RepID=UPI003B9D998F